MRALAAVGLALLLAGCGSTSPRDELAARLDEATVAANDRDAGALREAAQSLADTASAQRDAGTLPEATAQELIALATKLRQGADAVDPEVTARKEAEAREAAAARAREEAARQARADAERAAKQAAERARAEQDDEDEGGKGKGKDGGKDSGKDEKDDD